MRAQRQHHPCTCRLPCARGPPCRLMADKALLWRTHSSCTTQWQNTTGRVRLTSWAECPAPAQRAFQPGGWGPSSLSASAGSLGGSVPAGLASWLPCLRRGMLPVLPPTQALSAAVVTLRYCVGVWRVVRVLLAHSRSQGHAAPPLCFVARTHPYPSGDDVCIHM